jgi:hypothetical protein
VKKASAPQCQAGRLSEYDVFAGANHEHVQPVVPAAESVRELADQGLGREVVVMSLLVARRALR